MTSYDPRIFAFLHEMRTCLTTRPNHDTPTQAAGDYAGYAAAPLPGPQPGYLPPDTQAPAGPPAVAGYSSGYANPMYEQHHQLQHDYSRMHVGAAAPPPRPPPPPLPPQTQQMPPKTVQAGSADGGLCGVLCSISVVAVPVFVTFAIMMWQAAKLQVRCSPPLRSPPQLQAASTGADAPPPRLLPCPVGPVPVTAAQRGACGVEPDVVHGVGLRRRLAVVQQQPGGH